MDLTAVLDRPSISIKRTTEENLSELIDQINTEYGIDLKAEDYIDVPLPVVNPANPLAEFDVTITAKPDSYIVTGDYTFRINRVPDVSSNEVEDVVTVVVLQETNEPTHEHTLRMFDVKGTEGQFFDFLKGSTATTKVKIDDYFYIQEKGILLFGEFDFVYEEPGYPSVYVVSNCILISVSGQLLRDYNDQFDQGHGLVYMQGKSTKYIYAYDESNALGVSPSKIYRYGLDGVRMDYYPSFGQDVDYFTIDQNDRVLAVTKQFDVQMDLDNDPATPDQTVKVYDIIRLDVDGLLDATYSRTRVRTNSGNDPWKVGHIEAIGGDKDSTVGGLYVSFIPSENPSSQGESPIVNDVPLVPGNEPLYGYLPMVRILNNGTLDATFDVKQKSVLPAAVYTYDALQVPVTGKQHYTVTGNEVTYMSYRVNPITGHMQDLPMTYGQDGKLKPFTGEDYVLSPLWETYESIASARNNVFVIFGKGQLPNLAGGYHPMAQSVVSYNRYGKPLATVLTDVVGVNKILTTKLFERVL